MIEAQKSENATSIHTLPVWKS